MCDLCEKNGGQYDSCQDCGRLICFDEQPDSVDVIDQAYVTAGGDLFCWRCGRKYDEAEEEETEDYYEPPFDDEVEDDLAKGAV